MKMIKRCPKTGRIVGAVAGVAAIAWFLMRVVPKPSRAAYPCQQVAAGMGVGFLAWIAGAGVTWKAYRWLGAHLGPLTATAFGLAVCVVGWHGVAVGDPEDNFVPVLTLKEGRNHPMGKGRGIHPGRVVLDQNFDAAVWGGTSGYWWEDRNVKQEVVDRMFSASLQKLTGADSDRTAWLKLFTGVRKAGYRQGEKVVVKLNCNADGGKPWSNRGYPSPQVVYTLVRELVEEAGVPGKCIVLTDPSRIVGNNIYNKIRSNPKPDFQQVTFEGQAGALAPQRVRPEPDMQAPVSFDLPGAKTGTLYFPKSFTEAAYMINYALLRPHRVFGITGAGKNHFGSVYDPELKTFKPTMLHAYALWDYSTPNKHGDPHSHPALLGHKLTGGKTILYFADALYTSINQGGDVVRWKTLGDRWFSGMLMSQDPVALDSVAYDLITSEPGLVNVNPSFNGNVDSYLQEAALADRPPSGAHYNLPSLGVHEHWNNAAEKGYSRNLGRGEGIELVRLQ